MREYNRPEIIGKLLINGENKRLHKKTISFSFKIKLDEVWRKIKWMFKREKKY